MPRRIRWHERLTPFSCHLLSGTRRSKAYVAFDSHPPGVTSRIRITPLTAVSTRPAIRSRLSGLLSVRVPASPGPRPSGGSYCTTSGPIHGSRPTRHHRVNSMPKSTNGPPTMPTRSEWSTNHVYHADHALAHAEGRLMTPGFHATAAVSPSRIPRARLAAISTTCEPLSGGGDSPAGLKASSGSCAMPSIVIEAVRSFDPAAPVNALARTLTSRPGSMTFTRAAPIG